jgi:hypothetical protein
MVSLFPCYRAAGRHETLDTVCPPVQNAIHYQGSTVTSFIGDNFIITNNFAVTIYNIYYKLIPTTYRVKQKQNRSNGYEIFSSSEGKTKRDGIRNEIFKEVGIHYLTTESEEKQLPWSGYAKSIIRRKQRKTLAVKFK